MKKRQIIIVVVSALVILGGVLGSNGLASLKKSPERKTDLRTARVVSLVQVKNEDLPLEVSVNGRLKASSKVEIFPEVTGIVLTGTKPLKVGQVYQKGQVVLSIDGSESLLNLKSQRSAFKALMNGVLPDISLDYPGDFSSWKSFMNNVNPEKPLPTLPEVTNDKLGNFLSGRSVHQQYYAIKSLENRQSKFTIHAPFKCVVSSGDLNAGTLVRAGQKVGDLIAIGTFELEAAIAATDMNRVNIGDLALLQFEENIVEGKVIRIGKNVDPATQRMLLFLSVDGDGLQDGQYMEGSIQADVMTQVYPLDQGLLLADNKVYFAQDTLLATKQVEIVHSSANIVYVTGLSNGDRLLNQVIEGGYPGMWIKTNSEN
ncbi:MAG: membrane fusion protein (multidrug efflux system) [Flavobacteriales bacterium]|jgi:membrane fusion protein (multidrug efflux system)